MPRHYSGGAAPEVLERPCARRIIRPVPDVPAPPHDDRSGIPAVSVCIPVYNTERFVGDAVRSALSQTYQDFEVIIVDNASTDTTPQILASFTDPRIRVFRNDENIGAAANFNRAVSFARGRYLKVLCADDLLYPTCLEKQVAVLDADTAGAIAMVGCARDIIDDRGKRWLRRRFPGGAGRLAGATAIGMSVRSGTNIFGEPHAILVRTAAARAAGGFDPRYSFCIDLDLWTRLLSGGDLYVVDETLCAFRVSSNSWSSALARRQHIEFGRFVQDLEARGGVSVPAFDRWSAGVRARVNALLRQAFTRMVSFSAGRSRNT
jgi:GT2 family glycosyltransferase